MLPKQVIDMYRPKEISQMTTPVTLQVPVMSDYNGVHTKSYSNMGILFVNFKSYGGTEKAVNGILQVEETAVITCWYHPDVASNCRIVRNVDNAVFEILGEPENIEMRNMFLKFKVRRIKGGV